MTFQNDTPPPPPTSSLPSVPRFSPQQSKEMAHARYLPHDPGQVPSLQALALPVKWANPPASGLLENQMTSCSGWPTAEHFITSANIPRGHLGAGGARERNDSDTPPPPRCGGGVRVGGGSHGGKERECSQKTKQALSSCLLCFYLVI